MPCPAASISRDISPKGSCIVLRHSTLARTANGPHVFDFVMSCAASNIAGLNSSTSSHRSFCTCSPRTDACERASTSTTLPLLSRSSRSVIRPFTSPRSPGRSKNRRRYRCIRPACRIDPAMIRTSIPGLKIRSSAVATAPRNVFPPPRHDHTTQSIGPVPRASPQRSPAVAGATPLA